MAHDGRLRHDGEQYYYCDSSTTLDANVSREAMRRCIEHGTATDS
ncbi:hypothetical protein [Salinarchaeum chitinilyticum]